MSKASWLIVSMAFAAGHACGSDRASRGATTREVVYGVDGRTDYYEEAESRWRDLAKGSAVAIVRTSSLDETDPSDIKILGDTLRDANLCPQERFVDQPSIATCSGTLIDDDLVLTAGHCISSSRTCERRKLLFRFLVESEGQVGKITSEDVFSCQEIIVQRLIEGVENLDYAIVRLDRSAVPRHQPAPVGRALAALATDAALTMIGFPDGIPVKIERTGKVLDGRPQTIDYFTATTDSFAANSGSGIFDTEGALVGILVRGEDDYREEGGCLAVNVLPEDGSRGDEEATYAARAIQNLCDIGYSSVRLCTDTGTCGDGVCSVGETHASCPGECGEAECGNGRCETGEAGVCLVDCGAFGMVPPEWTCRTSFYATQDGCDCGCGVRDPDCDLVGQEILNCSAGQVCNSEGVCAASGDGGTPDAGPPVDAGVDAGVVVVPDASVVPDAGVSAPPDAGGQAADAGRFAGPVTVTGGGGCATVPGAVPSLPLWLLLMIGAVAWRGAYRRRSRASS